MKVKPGYYTTAELLKLGSIDIDQAAADYLDGQPDFRRVTIGGLGFGSLDDKISIPVTADHVEITLDGRIVHTLTVVLTKAQKAERAYAFEVAVDANE